MIQEDIDNIGQHCTSRRAEGFVANHKKKLSVSDYLCDLPEECNKEAFVEVQFKNTRKGYFLNSLGLELHKGDMVAVEAFPGHDIGEVTLTGRLVQKQMAKVNYRHPNGEPRRIYRLAKQSDMERYYEVKTLEQETMIRSRQIADALGLEMKIGDVEYQGDGLKAIFYYIAEGRVDFRQLIRKLAEAFHIRVEMKQIGARQEAGRIGGLGPCGRQLCCSGWMTSFVSVGTNAARLQDLSLNPQKLAGQCAKLKCCLNFEADTYLEAQQQLPHRSIELRTSVGDYRFMKADILAGELTYLPKVRDRREMAEPVTITKERAHEIIALNKAGKLPYDLQCDEEKVLDSSVEESRKDILLQSDMNRFDEERKERRQKRRKGNSNRKQKNALPTESSKEAPKEGNRRRRRRGGNRSPQSQGADGDERNRRDRRARSGRGENVD